MKLEEFASNNINILLKGEISGGKSIAAASFPNCYIFDFESRIRSIANYYRPRNKRDISFDTYTKHDFTKFQQKINDLEVYCPYETVVFDTLTSVVDLLLHHVVELRGTGKGSRVVGGLKMNTIEDYGAETSMLNSLMATIRAIPCKYKILVAHVVQREQKVGNISVITRQLVTAGKVAAQKVPAYFDEIYHMQQRPDEDMRPSFVALTSNTGDDFARTTLQLPREINFTGQSFYELIKEELEKEYKYPDDLPDFRPSNEDVNENNNQE